MGKRIGRQLNCVLAALLILSACCIPALAFPAGNLQVVVLDSTDQPVSDIAVELVCVAEVNGTAYPLKPEFADLGISGKTLFENPSAEHADKVYQYAYAREIGGIVQLTDAAGAVTFSGLNRGVYLVFEQGGQSVSFEPYLVTIPSVMGGVETYDMVSVPKTTETETETMVCQKFWEDSMNAAGKRPDSILVTLYRDGVPFRTVTLSAANSWQHKFYMLPNSGTYTIEEKPITEYQASYTPVLNGCLILNTYTPEPGGPSGPGGGGGGGGPAPEPETAHVSVTKIWNDDTNALGKRPASITVQLIQGSTVIKTAVLSEVNGWKHTFTGLDPSKAYTVKEIAITGYSAQYSGDSSRGIYILNSYTASTEPGTPPPPVVPQPQLVNIHVKVEWEDQDDLYGKRPQEVTVKLIADGSVIATLVLNPGCNWEGVFTSVPADLSYTVWQEAVAEYTTNYAGDAQHGFLVTNSYTEGTTDPGIPLPPTPPLPDEPQPPVDPEEIPAEPSGPSIPQTGAEVLPIYLMMVVGICMVLLGLVDLYWGRVRYEEEE